MYRMWERWRGRVGEREWPRWLKNLQVPDIDNGDKDIQKGGTMERRRGKERRRRQRDMLYNIYPPTYRISMQIENQKLRNTFKK